MVYFLKFEKLNFLANQKVNVFKAVQEVISMVAFNYVFPSEFVDDSIYQFKSFDGDVKINELGSFFIVSTDAALLRYHERANFCYALQNWNFT